MHDPALLTWVYLPTFFLLGLAHALEPGHSKTIVAAYLLSIKGKASDAVKLSITVTLAHTAIIFVLAVGSVFLSDIFAGEQVQHWLELASALLVFLIGGWLLQSRIHEWQHAHGHSHGHDHHHHHHGHHHHHELPLGQKLTFRQLIVMGLAGGMVPCPTALAIFILAIGSGKPLLGLIAITIFSLGLAVALAGIGVAVCKGVGFFQGKFNLDKWLQWLPIVSSAIVMLLGAWMLYNVVSGKHHVHEHDHFSPSVYEETHSHDPNHIH